MGRARDQLEQELDDDDEDEDELAHVERDGEQHHVDEAHPGAPGAQILSGVVVHRFIRPRHVSVCFGECKYGLSVLA